MSKLKESKYNEFIILEIEMFSSTATNHPLMTLNISNPVRGQRSTTPRRPPPLRAVSFF